MAEGTAYGLRRPLDIQQLQFEARHRWLRPAEISEILRNYQMFHITSEPHNRPPSGSLFLFDRKVLRYFRKDGHNWRKKKDGKTVKEAHEKLKVGSVDVLHCYYAHGEENENFQRRSYWMLEPDMMHIVFVHYLEVKGNKNIVVNTEGDDVSSGSQKVTSPSSSFPTHHSSVPSLSTDSVSPTTSLMSLREDADSEDIHQASSRLHLLCESQHFGNDPLMEKIDVGSKSSYIVHPFSGDHGQSSISGTDYIPVVHGDKFRGNNTAYIDDQKAHDVAPWGTVLQSIAKWHDDPSLASFSSIPSSLMGSVLEQEHTIFGNLLMSKRGLTEEAASSRSLQSNWQIPLEDNSGQMPMLTQTQLFDLPFRSDYGSGLLGNETGNASSEISPILYSFHGEPKEQSMQQNYYPQEYADGQSQYALKSNSANEIPDEDPINYGLTVKSTLLDKDESLKKVDSFSRWITRELGEVADLNMQCSRGISLSTDECQHVIDDTSLSPSLSQDQLFSINDFSPKWAYAESEIEVLIIGSFLKSQPEVTASNWSCMFGEVEVPAEVLADGILYCQAPCHKDGRVPFYVTCSNRLACSEVREFDFREGFARNVDFADFYNSSTEMLRLEHFLSLKPVDPSNHSFEGDMEKKNLIFKLISLREEEEYSIKDEPTPELDISQHTVKEYLFHRHVKEKLYSWLLRKVTESGKGPNVLDEDGQGVLHLAAFLGYDWAINPIISAGVNINFRDVNGWTALHWAASCGRERTVGVLVSLGANCGALTDPSPTFPSGRTAADLASSNGHKGISGFLAESSLTDHLETLTMDDKKGDRQEISGMKVVQTVSERTATPVLYGDMPDALCLKDSLTAVRNATQAADRIHQVYRMQSFQRKQLTQYEGDELGLSDQQALSLLAYRACKSGQGDGLANAAAIQIQKKFRGWKKRKEFLMIRQRIVKIQAHVRGHQVRKQYKPILWSVGILEKVILRWRRRGSGLRGFRPNALSKAPSQQNDSLKEDDYDYLKEGRKQKEEKIQKALTRVKSMVQYPEGRAQYRRLLTVVEDFRQTKASNKGLINSEETVDGVEDLIDIDMLLDDDNFNPIAFN